ncbi:3-oxoacyl-[acyl-carrier protein] reductase [Novosphingobium sp. PhB165]|uniref:SDR family NAD(P)-dependent oxidoreductase n=1 Tax=Novosphingobium sp. PhB165 TaxID=2485105 RepID=UPI00104E652F|nr:SDR family oxidoreductase [Novosphingobium sp. PhB165]TCM19929.1 3-oxoacyl-[acyl-carrier protein] reductase [Novosphingobium sp. PhB165]
MAGDERNVLLLAGGSGSIGSAIAHHALMQGWQVALHGRTAGKVEAHVASLSAYGNVQGILADVTESDAAQRIVTAAAEHYGRIDAVIDCIATGPAGIAGLFTDTSPAAYGRFLDLSVGWLERLAHAAYPFLAARGGTLIGLVSDAGIHAAPRQTLIGAARAGAIGFLRNFAMEAARDGIRAHAISPSFVEGTDSAVRMGSERMAKAATRAGLGLPTADDIAPLALFLCSEGARRITGQVISVNGGLNA